MYCDRLKLAWEDHVGIFRMLVQKAHTSPDASLAMVAYKRYCMLTAFRKNTMRLNGIPTEGCSYMELIDHLAKENLSKVEMPVGKHKAPYLEFESPSLRRFVSPLELHHIQTVAQYVRRYFESNLEKQQRFDSLPILDPSLDLDAPCTEKEVRRFLIGAFRVFVGALKQTERIYETLASPPLTPMALVDYGTDLLSLGEFIDRTFRDKKCRLFPWIIHSWLGKTLEKLAQEPSKVLFDTNNTDQTRASQQGRNDSDVPQDLASSQADTEEEDLLADDPIEDEQEMNRRCTSRRKPTKSIPSSPAISTTTPNSATASLEKSLNG